MDLASIDIVINLVLGSACGYFFWKLRNIETRLLSTMSETQVKEMIDLKGEKALLLNRELRDDVKRLEHKVDEMIHLLLAKK